MKTKLLTILTLLLCVCSGAWAVTPVTTTYGTQTYLDVANTTKNVTVETTNYVTLLRSDYSGVNTWYKGGSNNTGDIAGSFDAKTMPGFLNVNGWNEGLSIKNASGYIRPFFVTGTTGVAILGNDNNNSDKILKIVIEEVSEDGTLTAVGSKNGGNGDNKKSYMLDYGNTLSANKYYKITVTSDASSNSRFAQIRFTQPSAPASYTVTYKANGGTGTIADGTGTDITLSDGTGFTAPANYSFAGWNTANDGSGTSYAAGQTNVNADLDLFATWTQNGTIDANTGSANTTYTATLNATSIAIATAPTKAGNVLKGYYTETTGGTKVANADGTLVASTSYTDENGKWTNSGAAPTLYAQWEEIVYYTVTLNPNGGTIDDATGWTLDNGQYKKTSVASGTELELPTFTKENRTLLTWRDDSDNEYSSPITVNSNLTITAIWGKEKETIIYSWESPSGTAIETGGTATHYNANGAVAGNTRVNYLHGDSGYYTISLNGKADYSSDHIRIALDENIKTGDEVRVTAFRYNTDNTKTAGPKMNTQSGDLIFAESSSIVNIQSGGDPVLYKYTVPADINTDAVKLTRNLTGTATFITKLQIVRTEVVEEQDPCETPNITTQPVGADYEWSDVIAPMTVTASVTDGGTLSYQWYKKGTPNVEVGTNSASYTPSEAGTYFVIVTNTKDGYDDASATSNDAVITITAQPTYEITFLAGEGSGTVPTEEPKVDGAEFTLPGQGSMVAPANKYFTGWNDGTNDYAEGATYTMSDEAVTLTALWTALPVATANHYKYSYNDAQHYVNSTYRNPRGGIAASGDNQSIPNGNLCESLGGITSVAITSAKYDGKDSHMNSYIKIETGGSSKVTITIAEGYEGTLTLKANGYSANAGISVSGADLVSGEEGGVATIEDNFNALVYTLPAGTHDITCSSKNMYISEMDITTEVVSVSGTISASGWNTFSSNYALDLNSISATNEVAAYYASAASGSSVTMSTTSATVPAGEGLMIKGTVGDTFTINVAQSGTSIDGNLLVGLPNGGTVPVAVAGEGVNYVFGWTDASNPGFYKIESDTPTLGAGKAYLHTTSALGSKLGLIFDDGETTNIKLNVNDSLDSDAAMYNLAGQKVSNSYKGIVIVNGKKYVCK